MVVVIVSFLLVIAISRLLAVQAEAERVGMKSVLGTLRSAIGIKVATHFARSDMGSLWRSVGSNPMDQLSSLPKNYLGELDDADPAGLEDGHWYFDKRDGVLVYLVRHKAGFAGGLSDPPRARFAIELVYVDRNGNGHYDRHGDEVKGLRLSALEPYHWEK